MREQLLRRIAQIEQNPGTGKIARVWAADLVACRKRLADYDALVERMEADRVRAVYAALSPDQFVLVDYFLDRGGSLEVLPDEAPSQRFVQSYRRQRRGRQLRSRL